MRTIKFRGKSKGGKWLYGDLLHRDGEIYILPEDAVDSMNNYEVLPETVGQFTGLTDGSGKDVYEGDIMRIPETEFNVEIIGSVEYDRGLYVVRSFLSGTYNSLPWVIRKRQVGVKQSTVIGNIYDNPELNCYENTSK